MQFCFELLTALNDIAVCNNYSDAEMTKVGMDKASAGDPEVLQSVNNVILDSGFNFDVSLDELIDGMNLVNEIDYDNSV